MFSVTDDDNFIIYKMRKYYDLYICKNTDGKIDLTVAVATDCAAAVFLTVIVECLVFQLIL